MTIALQKTVIYGPVLSRRLGWSLGINLLPPDCKLCSFDCVYCQYGRTAQKNFNGVELVPAGELLQIARRQIEALRKKDTRIECWTLAGNGEPTLHPELNEIIRGLIPIRDEFCPKTPLVILSNSSTVDRPEIREALSLLDHRYMKLDAGTPALFKGINRPMGQVEWEAMVEGLRLLKDTTLQSLFVEGSANNTSGVAIETWIAAVKRISPIAVQLYTIGRETADPGVQKVSRKRLDEIASLLKELGTTSVSVFS